MKHKLFFILVAIICFSFMPKPNVYYFSSVDPVRGFDGRKPEKTTAVYQKPKGKATTTEYVISGSKSSVRLKIEETNFFAYPDESSKSLNAFLYISLYKVSSGKSNRTLSMTPDGGGVMWLPVNINKVSESAYKILPGVAMQPGEYAIVDKTTITAEGNYTVWTFGID